MLGGGEVFGFASALSRAVPRASKTCAGSDFNDLVRREFAADWDELLAEWQAYVATLDHGYDFERMAIRFGARDAAKRQAAEVTIAADRGWQSSGVWLEAGKTYRVAARGRYQIAVENGGDGLAV